MGKPIGRLGVLLAEYRQIHTMLCHAMVGEGADFGFKNTGEAPEETLRMRGEVRDVSGKGEAYNVVLLNEARV